MRTSRKPQRRPYLVARGSACIFCRAHDWRAFKEPEERDLMSPCTLTPVYTIWASTKREAIARAKERCVKGGQQ
jgi:hypothetical protein